MACWGQNMSEVLPDDKDRDSLQSFVFLQHRISIRKMDKVQLRDP